MRLGSLCSEYGWSLWGFIQAATSPIDFDFHAWGMHRYEKAVRTFTGPDFDAAARRGRAVADLPSRARVVVVSAAA